MVFRLHWLLWLSRNPSRDAEAASFGNQDALDASFVMVASPKILSRKRYPFRQTIRAASGGPVRCRHTGRRGRDPGAAHAHRERFAGSRGLAVYACSIRTRAPRHLGLSSQRRARSKDVCRGRRLPPSTPSFFRGQVIQIRSRREPAVPPTAANRQGREFPLDREERIAA